MPDPEPMPLHTSRGDEWKDCCDSPYEHELAKQIEALTAERAALRTLLEDAENYIQQAQVFVLNADRKGAAILGNMGGRILSRIGESND